ncbi:cyclase [Streptomyces sp. NPDC057445]|uniref:cyclase n=1 Tax=Streptomyces sp. NPDC057445 TaxID=3346136 RepID=UPI00367E937B
MRSAFSRKRLPMALAAGLALAGMAVGPASAAETPLTFGCQATPPIGGAQNFDVGTGVNATAPESVASGSDFKVTLAPSAITVPGSVNGYTVKTISNIKLSMPVPANATLTGKSLSGGSGIGSGVPSIAVSGNTVVMTVPGPIKGGSTFTLPAVNLDLKAGAAGTAVTTQLAGSSHSDPGLTFTASVTVVFFPVSVPTSCYPSPNPVLSTTTVD